VTLILYERHTDVNGRELPLTKDDDGVWEISVAENLTGSYYGYRVSGPQEQNLEFDPSVVLADPYSHAVVTKNNYRHAGRSIILSHDYDWEGDTWMSTPMEDLIIYEMHVRDMSAHPSSGITHRGTYAGMTERGKAGGLDYLLDLGINAVELLPVQDFANIELPYMDESTTIMNSWNPYERNHWGYMPTYFFAPESYYATGASLNRDGYCGIDGRQVREFKDMVKRLHRHGVAVIMDVVFNHVSQYDYNPLKYIDADYYFRKDANGNFLSKSGCGNDLKTERPMVRRMIIDSITHWMTEYHIDGFRFDLAYLIDEVTRREILKAARRINPNVYIIAEPWGDGYDPPGFSRIGWAAWNDRFRNGVKGQNPFDNPGFIFGEWEGGNNIESLKSYVNGYTVSTGGFFQEKAHSVNYLESHDDHTLGDFIRIALGDVDENDNILDADRHASLTHEQLKRNKLAALFLLTSQGPSMMHAGQEFARSKVIAKTDVPDNHAGRIDHNSYEKDDETNYIDYQHQQMNDALVEYYRGLISARKMHPAFRRSDPDDIRFLNSANAFGLGYHIDSASSGDTHAFVVLMNGDAVNQATFALPEGLWDVIVDAESVVDKGVIISGIEGNITIPPATGMILSQ
jgi:pullulanase/glycogen debranching enzyme